MTLRFQFDAPPDPVDSIEQIFEEERYLSALDRLRVTFTEQFQRRTGRITRTNLRTRIRELPDADGVVGDFRPMPALWLRRDLLRRRVRLHVRSHLRRTPSGGATTVRRHRRRQFQAFGRLQGRFAGSWWRHSVPQFRNRGELEFNVAREGRDAARATVQREAPLFARDFGRGLDTIFESQRRVQANLRRTRDGGIIARPGFRRTSRVVT